MKKGFLLAAVLALTISAMAGDVCLPPPGCPPPPPITGCGD